MDLVHKQDGHFPQLPSLFRLGHYLSDFLHSAGDCAEVLKVCLCAPGNDPGKGGFAYPRRSPENHGGDLIPLNEIPQYLSLSQKMLLPYKFRQIPGAYPAGQRGTIHIRAIKQTLLHHLFPSP